MSRDTPDPYPPTAFRFSLRIDHIRCEEDPQSPTRENPPDFYWSPPISRSQFVKTYSTDWLTWDPDSCTIISPDPGAILPSVYKRCTMFWCRERHGYLVVPVDCTDTDLRAEPIRWRRLSFGSCANRPGTALVGYHKERYALHMPGPNHWFEDLLPDVYKPEECDGPTCTLAGDLSILVGLIAFSSPPAYAADAVGESFRPERDSTRFQPHGLPKSERHKTRGMVITIGFEPPFVTADDLKAWEDGDHGAIFS
ncbi:hypothetical protein PV04_04083 [Phialophora macrospora]|uniref:Uncharacterized protein n=1 Tax=Phialophora macrospora TaxID=1851006 RepID=A0A0D2CSG7_9EURO|nr:hypothetical protein PV04_04083 [Phialophora macrospora]